MAEENKPNDQKSNDKIVVPPADNNGSNADAHWQKIADQRFAENEQLKKDLEEAKKKSESKTELEELRAKINVIETEKEKTRLETEYPDIEPDLILGKTPDEQKQIVERQRLRTTNFQKNSIDVNAPQYTQQDIDSSVEKLQKSNLTPIQKAQEVLRLNRLRAPQ